MENDEAFKDIVKTFQWNRYPSDEADNLTFVGKNYMFYYNRWNTHLNSGEQYNSRVGKFFLARDSYCGATPDGVGMEIGNWNQRKEAARQRFKKIGTAFSSFQG